MFLFSSSSHLYWTFVLGYPLKNNMYHCGSWQATTRKDNQPERHKMNLNEMILTL